MNTKYNEELNFFLSLTNLSPLMNKSIMITGASGLIGSYTVDVLMRANETKNNQTQVYAIVRNMEKAMERFNQYAKHHLFHLIEQDVSAPNSFNFPVDYIIHAASGANPRSFNQDPIGTIKTNIEGTLYLLDYAEKFKTSKFLFISSSEVYGEPIVPGTKYKESSMGIVDQMKPRACYPESKRMAENICVNYMKQYGVNICIARVGFAYGPTFTTLDDRVVPQFLREALNGKDIILQSSGALVRSYIYIFDVVSGLFKILFEGQNGEAYNIANCNSNVSILEIAERISEVAGVNLVFDLPIAEKDKGYAPFSESLLDATKLESLGWKAIFDIKSGVENTFAVLKAKK